MNLGGVGENAIANWKAEKLAQYFPEYRNMADEAKEQIATAAPIPEIPVTPTRIGELLSAKLGYPKLIQAKIVNGLLIGAKLQEKKERISKKTNKKKYYYELTKLGKNYDEMILTGKQNSAGQVTQIRWYSTVVDYLAATINNSLVNEIATTDDSL